MGGLKKPKKPDAPKPQAPPPTVQETQPAEEIEMKKQRRQSGYQKTMLTGALAPETSSLG